MAAIFLNTLARLRGQIIGWGIAMFLLGLMMLSFYPTIVEQGDDLLRLVESYPPEVMAFFGGDFSDFTSPSGFLSAEYFSFLPVILGIFALLAGSGLLASDEENGTLDLIAAHPISRTTLFGGRLLAFVVGLLLILLLAWLGLVLGAVLFDFDATALEMLRPFLSMAAVLLLFGTLALLLSLLLPSRRLAALVTGIALVGSYFVTSLANLSDALKPLARLSPLTYYQSGDAMLALDGGWLVGLLAGSALFAALAWWRFERRDIRVAGEGGWRLPALRRRATT